MRLLCWKHSVASGTSGSHVALAQISTFSRAEMLRGRREGGGRRKKGEGKEERGRREGGGRKGENQAWQPNNHDCSIMHLIMTSMMSLVLSQAVTCNPHNSLRRWCALGPPLSCALWEACASQRLPDPRCHRTAAHGGAGRRRVRPRCLLPPDPTP